MVGNWKKWDGAGCSCIGSRLLNCLVSPEFPEFEKKNQAIKSFKKGRPRIQTDLIFLSTINTPCWFETYKELFFVLIGGLCAAFGGVANIWYTARKTRKIKMEETIGQQKVEIYQKALSIATQLEGLAIQGTPEDISIFTDNHHSWVCDNIIFLPEKYEQNWKSIRANLRTIRRITQGEKAQENADKLASIESFIDKLAEEMETIIRKELKLKAVEILRPEKKINTGMFQK